MSSEEAFESQLLDLHLGRLSQIERAGLLARIAADPKLAEQHEALTDVFRALNTQQHVTAPADLAARISTRVAAAGRPPRIVRPTDDLTQAAEQATGRVLRIGNLREIIAAAAMIVLMVSFGVPGLLHMRERGQRMACTANLAALGQGLQQYAQTFNASLPFAGWNPQTSWSPSSDPDIATIPNRRHVYPLLLHAYVHEPRLFVCPGRGGIPMPKSQVAQRIDFIESDNVNYSYYNMAGVRPSLQDNPNLPIMADENPLFEDGVPLFTRLGFGDRASSNSRAHRSVGQNVLTLDGHVQWSTTPFSGLDDDNIWTLEDVEDYTGREGPQSSADAHLIK